MDRKAVVRDGYDKVSFAYRNGEASFDYAARIKRACHGLQPGDGVLRFLDLGCGCGQPVTGACRSSAASSA